MEVTSFSKSGEHEIRNRKEENHMDEKTKKRLDQQFAFIQDIRIGCVQANEKVPAEYKNTG